MNNNTWFVVADGSRARVLARVPREERIVPALSRSFVGSRQPTRDRVTDRAGQTLERHGPGGHSKAKSQDAKEHDQELLARDVAAAIRGARGEGRFDQLVLIAPPAFLGQLRAVLDAATTRLIASTHAKDLSKLSQHELEQRLLKLSTN